MNPIITSLLLGGLSGLVAALCGVGGGIILVPAFVFFLGLDQKTAVATSLTAIILTAFVATVRNNQNHLIDWKVVIPTAIGAAIVAWFSADALKHLSNEVLTRIFAILMVIVGTRMLFK